MHICQQQPNSLTIEKLLLFYCCSLGKKIKMKNREKTPWLVKCIIAVGLLIEITKSSLMEAMTKTLVFTKKDKNCQQNKLQVSESKCLSAL